MNSFFEGPKVFTNKCVKRKVERVVPWPAVALAKAAQRIGNRAVLLADIAPLAITSSIVSPRQADPPLRNLSYRLRPNEYPRWVLPPPMARLPPAADSGSNSAVYK